MNEFWWGAVFASCINSALKALGQRRGFPAAYVIAALWGTAAAVIFLTQWGAK